MRKMPWLIGFGTLLLTVAVAPANVLVNPGFEDGATGQINQPIPGWLSWGNSGWHHDDAGRVIDTKAIKFWWDDAGVWQDATAVGGAQYDIGVMVFNATSDRLTGWNAMVKAEFYNAALGTDAGHRLASQEWRYYSAGGAVDQWVHIGGTITAPANADIVRIVMQQVDWQSSGVGGSINFDNAAINLVPEPTSLALFALAALASWRRR